MGTGGSSSGGKALRARSARAVMEAAAAVVRERRVQDGQDLAAAFERLLGDARAQDPGALAKTALARALLWLQEEHPEALACSLRTLFLRGARHVQLDPVRGGRVDVAGELRTVCAAGLLTLGDAEAIEVLTDHLADAEGPVRRAAAQNLAKSGHGAAPLVLRLKARHGDEEPDILGEVLRALLAADPGAVDVVTPWLASPDEAVLAEAALALAEARPAGALAALCDAYASSFDAERRRILLASIGTLRSDEACAFLLEVVQEGAAGTACDALEGLRPFAHETSCRERAATAVEARGEAEVRQAFREVFGSA